MGQIYRILDYKTCINIILSPKKVQDMLFCFFGIGQKICSNVQTLPNALFLTQRGWFCKYMSTFPGLLMFHVNHS